MSKKDQRAILTHLANIMVHIIKWSTQPVKRSKSWIDSIRKSRNAIEKLQEDTPSLNNLFFKNNWDKNFEKAKNQAEIEMNQKSDINELTRKQVFDDKYSLDKD